MILDYIKKPEVTGINKSYRQIKTGHELIRRDSKLFYYNSLYIFMKLKFSMMRNLKWVSSITLLLNIYCSI